MMFDNNNQKNQCSSIVPHTRSEVIYDLGHFNEEGREEDDKKSRSARKTEKQKRQERTMVTNHEPVSDESISLLSSSKLTRQVSLSPQYDFDSSSSCCESIIEQNYDDVSTPRLSNNMMLLIRKEIT